MAPIAWRTTQAYTHALSPLDVKYGVVISTVTWDLVAGLDFLAISAGSPVPCSSHLFGLTWPCVPELQVKGKAHQPYVNCEYNMKSAY